ncbi:MAG: hypothetical protein AAF569_02880 [Pseudomonadota bacterium]
MIGAKLLTGDFQKESRRVSSAWRPDEKYENISGNLLAMEDMPAIVGARGSNRYSMLTLSLSEKGREKLAFIRIRQNKAEALMIGRFYDVRCKRTKNRGLVALKSPTLYRHKVLDFPVKPNVS